MRCMTPSSMKTFLVATYKNLPDLRDIKRTPMRVAMCVSHSSKSWHSFIYDSASLSWLLWVGDFCCQHEEGPLLPELSACLGLKPCPSCKTQNYWQTLPRFSPNIAWVLPAKACNSSRWLEILPAVECLACAYNPRTRLRAAEVYILRPCSMLINDKKSKQIKYL